MMKLTDCIRFEPGNLISEETIEDRESFLRQCPCIADVHLRVGVVKRYSLYFMLVYVQIYICIERILHMELIKVRCGNVWCVAAATLAYILSFNMQND